METEQNAEEVRHRIVERISGDGKMSFRCSCGFGFVSFSELDIIAAENAHIEGLS